jgi:Domain of unknown function (DUF4440)
MVTLFIMIAGSTKTFAQTESEKLTATILHLDSAFWNAYNNCDTTAFANYLTDDVEFYHDKGGITLGATALIHSLNKNLCSNANYHLRREAVAGTVKVYPMQNGNEIYGAIISGEHLFYITANGKPEYLDGQANFSQLWLLKNGVWKMARILSYNHHPADYINTRKEIVLPADKSDALAGEYNSKQFGSFTVKRSNNVLVLTAGNETYTLYPESDTSFFTKDRDLVFEFIKGASNKPIKLVVKEHGAVADEAVFIK